MDDMSPGLAPDPSGGPGPGYPEAGGQPDPGPRDPSGDSDGDSGPHQLDVADALDALLGQVDAALARLDAGTYGRCGTCGVELDEELLDRFPTAAWCAACDALARVADHS